MRIIFLVIVLMISLKSYGQNVTFDKPNELPSTINSYAEEVNPVLSPDGSTLFFSRVLHEDNIGGKFAGADIWISKRKENGEWGEAINPGRPLNNKAHNFVIGINSEGNKIYLINTYKSDKKYKVAVAEKFMNWEDPEPIKITLPEHTGPIGMFMHPSEEILMVSMNTSNSYGKEDIFVVLKDSTGNWGSAINLGATINTAGFEISPFLGADSETLYFTSSGHPGYGDADIYVSKRLYNTWNVWSKPVNLGKSVNDEFFNAYLIASNNNFYFSSNKKNKYSNLYQVDMKETVDSTTVKINKMIEDAKKLIEK